MTVKLENSYLNSGASGVAPAANSTITTLTGLEDGYYEVFVSAFQIGTADSNYTNAELRHNTVTVGDILTVQAPTPVKLFRGMLKDDTLTLRTGADVGGAGSVYVGFITATRI